MSKERNLFHTCDVFVFSTGSDISINVTEGMEHKTRLMENNATQMNFTGFNMTRYTHTHMLGGGGGGEYFRL